MELSFFKTIDSRDTPLNRIDGRLKTVLFLLCIVISAIVRHWFFALALWVAAIAAYSTLHIQWRRLLIRLAMPFTIAWLVLLSVIFTNGSHPFFVIMQSPFHLIVYREGAELGLLLMLRIMAAVSIASLLSFSTPMVEILETLRKLKIPGIMVDIAELMARYIYTIEETAHNMRRAQASRTTCKISWIEQIRNIGAVAGYVMIKSFDHSVKIYNSMLSRGYVEENAPVPYFASSMTPPQILKGVVISAIPVAALIADYMF